MNAIFHYYAVKLLALRGGFSQDDAEIIAFSCQLVDRSLIPIKVDCGASVYTVIPTHHFGFWDKTQEDQVWIPFHFFPSGESDESPRKDGRNNPLAVRPNSPPVKELLISALKSRNPYRVGIALHTYADTWAHQNFIGRNSIFNRMESFSPIPPVGHAQIGRNPDIWSMEWQDSRLEENKCIIDNDQRFMASAEKIYKYLATFNRRNFEDWDLVKWELEEITAAGRSQDTSQYPRQNRVAEDHHLQLEFRLRLECPELDPGLWFTESLAEPPNDAVLRQGNTDRITVANHEIRKLLNLSQLPPRKPKGKFEDSRLYRWSEAAREHKRTADEILAQL